MINIEKYRNNALTMAILMDAGIDLMRQNFRRRHPAADELQIDQLMSAWLHREDDPIPGDTAGQVRIREQVP